MGEAPRSDESDGVTRSTVEDQEHEDQDQLASTLPPKQDALLVFDWDDTILPTSWLLRVHALTADAPMRPEVQRQVSALALVALQTLNMAQTMGTVIIITNSAPGWVDQSCQLFMPQLLPHVRRLHIAAKPLNAPLTFKINAFRRECRQFRNLVSIGDGDAERVASLRLGADARSRMPPTAAGSEDPQAASQWIKSVKLIELPTCQQLVSQHGMLQGRLRDVTAFQGSLDLKARAGPAGAQCPSPRGGAGAQSSFSLVHFGRAPAGVGPPAPCGRGPGIVGAASTSPARVAAQPDEGTRASAFLGAARSHSAGHAGTAGGAHGQLPLIGRPATQQEEASASASASLGLRGRGATPTTGGARGKASASGEATLEAPEPAGGGAREDTGGLGTAVPGAPPGGGAAGGEGLWKVQMKTTGAGSKTAYQSPQRKRAVGDSNVPYPSSPQLSRNAPPMTR